MTDQLSVSGRVEADETRLGVLMPGQVSVVSVKEGTMVHKGEELLRLDSTMLATQLKSIDDLILQAESEKKGISQLVANVKKAPAPFPDNEKQRRSSQKTIDLASAVSKSAPSEKTINSSSQSNGSTAAKAQSDAANALRQGELTEQLNQLDEAQALQLKILNEATGNMLATVDGAYSRETAMLKEGREEAERNSGNKSFFSTIAKAKLSGINEVFSAKEKALTQAYQAQRKAITESAVSKESALKESIESRKASVRQLFSAKETMVDEFANERSKIQESIEKQKNLLKSTIRVEGREQARAALQKIKEAGVRSQTQIVQMQTDQAHARLSMLETELIKARAMRNELKSKIELCSIKSPIDGVCVSRSVQPGELVGPGPTLLKLADLNSLYVRALVSEGDLAAIKIGQRGEVRVDSPSAKPIGATLTAIDSKPCFTPKGVYFKEDRVKEAFGIKLSIDEPTSVAKPGMPVDVTIFLSGKGK